MPSTPRRWPGSRRSRRRRAVRRSRHGGLGRAAWRHHLRRTGGTAMVGACLPRGCPRRLRWRRAIRPPDLARARDRAARAGRAAAADRSGAAPRAARDHPPPRRRARRRGRSASSTGCSSRTLHRDHLDCRSLRMVCDSTPGELVVPRWRWARRSGKRASGTRCVRGGRGRRRRGARARDDGVHEGGAARSAGASSGRLRRCVEAAGERIYFAGDTGGVRRHARARPVDVALMPIWGWGPTLGRAPRPRGAVEALKLLRPACCPRSTGARCCRSGCAAATGTSCASPWRRSCAARPSAARTFAWQSSPPASRSRCDPPGARHGGRLDAGAARAQRLAAAGLPGRPVGAGLAAAAVCGVLNAVVWPLLIRFALPFTVLTLGLGALVLNGARAAAVAAALPASTSTDARRGIVVALGLTAVTTLVGGVLALDRGDLWYRHVVAPPAERPQAGGATEVPGLMLPGDRRARPRRAAAGACATATRPMLARWMHDGGHRLHAWETDWSSQTGACQAGLLHGDNDDMPAFRWWEKDLGRAIVTNHPRDAAEIERRHSDGRGLLHADGASRGEHPLRRRAAQHADDEHRARRDRPGRLGQDYFAYFASPYSVARTLLLVDRRDRHASAARRSSRSAATCARASSAAGRTRSCAPARP